MSDKIPTPQEDIVEYFRGFSYLSENLLGEPRVYPLYDQILNGLSSKALGVLFKAIEAYGNSRELEGRIDEYLNAEEAWFNDNNEYFDNRQGRLERQKGEAE